MDQPTFDVKDVSRVECRFAVFCDQPNAYDEHGQRVRKDMHFVKEIIHFKDGTSIPYTRPIYNYKRPYWITKPAFQNHEDKKESAPEKTLQKFMSTQSQLVQSIAKHTGNYNARNLRQVCRSPYVYGADILSTALIKRDYLDRFPGEPTPFSMAAGDIETDVVKGHDGIIMMTISYGSRVFTSIAKEYVEGISMPTEKLQEMLKKYLSNITGVDPKKKTPISINVYENRKLNWEIEYANSPAEVVIQVINKAHEWKPDWFSFWNIDFDITKIISTLEDAGIDPADVFCDPSVPSYFRNFRYKRGPSQKVTASGKVTPIKPSARWHTAYVPASFYLIDGMCVYRHARNGQQEESSYSLDFILDKILGVRKLDFKEADQFNGNHSLPWHRFMQTHYRLEYVIYNVFDCISMELLDEVTRDLNLTVPMLSGVSDFENFKSQPRRVVDELHFAVQASQQKIMATTSDQMSDDFDEDTVGVDGWIVMLPAHLIADNGLKVIEEYPEMTTNIRRGVGDLDVAASYPNGGCVFNISKETTVKEIISIEGVDEFTMKHMGINLCGGPSNAVEICCNIYKLPSLTDMLDAFLKDEQCELVV